MCTQRYIYQRPSKQKDRGRWDQPSLTEVIGAKVGSEWDQPMNKSKKRWCMRPVQPNSKRKKMMMGVTSPAQQEFKEYGPAAVEAGRWQWMGPAHEERFK